MKQSMTDQYYSRLLSIARQNKGIKFIKNVKDDQIEVELEDGSAEWRPFEEVINYKVLVNQNKNKNNS